MGEKPWWDKEWLASEYEGKSIEQIADENNTSPSTIHTWLKKHNIERREWGQHPDSNQYKDPEWLKKKYHEENLSGSEMADLCGTTKQTIYDWMRRHDIDRRDKSESATLRAEKHPHTTEAGAEALKEHGVNPWEYWDEEEREAFRERLSKERQGDGNPMAGVTGEDHHNYKENPAPHRFYQSTKWKETREEALQRDDHECQACGKEEDLHVHHIQPVSAGGPRFELNNLVTLCDTHHREWEGLYLRPDTR
jgi:transposase